MSDIRGTYFASVRKDSYRFFIDLKYKIEGKNWISLNDKYIFDNTNELLISTFIPGKNNEIYFKNKSFLEENKFIIIELPEIDINDIDYKDEQGYVKRYLNNINMYTLEDYNVFQLVYCDDAISDFEKFKHNNEGRSIRIDKPETEMIYIAYRNRVYGKFSHEKKRSGYTLLKPNSHLYRLNSYNIEDLEILYINRDRKIGKNYQFVVMDNRNRYDYEVEDFIEIESLISMIANSSDNIKIGKNQMDSLVQAIKKNRRISEEEKNLLINRVDEQKLFEEAIDTIVERTLKDKQKIDKIVENILDDEAKLDKILKNIIEKYPEKIEEYGFKRIENNINQNGLKLPSKLNINRTRSFTEERKVETYEVKPSLHNKAKKIRNQILHREDSSMDYTSSYQLVDEVREFINKKSNMELSYNEVVNILICVSQGFLTIFAGEPGTGKTSLCNTLAKSLGLNTGDENSRFLEISVEKGWTSKNDFVGYYNPLTGRFDSANSKVFEALTILNEEKLLNDEGVDFLEFPYLIMLDEANLSSMEHYWADFMNVCDGEPDKDYFINLGKEHIYSIPPYLRFLATINYDHTTEELSPRLIDRSWIILLEYRDLLYGINSLKNEVVLNNESMVKFNMLKKFMNLDNKNMPEQIANVLDDIIGSLRANGIHIGYRVCKMMKDYCAVAAEQFEIENEVEECYTEVLDFAVAQKILPLIDGYGNEFREFLTKFKDEQLIGMTRSQAIVQKIITTGDKNMKHYHFFAR